MEVENAKIDVADVFVEDHGILTIDLRFTGSGWGQGLPLYSFGKDAHKLGWFVQRVLDTVGKYKLSELKGTYVRVKREGGKIAGIGHILDDRWFNPGTEFGNAHNTE